MGSFGIKNAKVWKVEKQNGFTKLNLGDSTKKKDGTWENFTWYGVHEIVEDKRCHRYSKSPVLNSQTNATVGKIDHRHGFQ